MAGKGPAAPGGPLPCRITDMSKASMSSRPEPGYENMDHFSINVDYVAEMLRTIEFQTGACPGEMAVLSPGALGLPGLPRAPGRAPSPECPVWGSHTGLGTPTCSPTQGPWRVSPAPGSPGSHTGLVTFLLGCPMMREGGREGPT